jgi:hypothetical protein
MSFSIYLCRYWRRRLKLGELGKRMFTQSLGILFLPTHLISFIFISSLSLVMLSNKISKTSWPNDSK